MHVRRLCRPAYRSYSDVPDLLRRTAQTGGNSAYRLDGKKVSPMFCSRCVVTKVDQFLPRVGDRGRPSNRRPRPKRDGLTARVVGRGP